MPNPITTATARPDLSRAFMQMQLDQLQSGFVGLRVFPYFNTAIQAGTFKKVTIKSLMESVDTKRAPGASYARSRWQFTDDGFYTSEHGEEEPLDDREAAIYADYFDFELIATARARRMVMFGHEERVAAAMAASTNTSAGSDWSDYSSATPLTDIETRIRTLRSRGVIANQVVMSWTDFRDCRLCDEVTDKIASQGAGRSIEPGSISAQDLARLFGVPEVVVAEGLKDANGAQPNDAVSITDIWTPGTVYVHRASASPDLAEPCSGRTILWTGDGAQEDGTIETYRDETVRSNIVRCRHESQEKVMFAEAIEKITGTQG